MFTLCVAVIHFILLSCAVQREEGLLPSSVLLLPGTSRCLPPTPPPAVPPAPPLSDSPVRERARLYWGQQLRPLLLPYVTLYQRPTAHLIEQKKPTFCIFRGHTEKHEPPFCHTETGEQSV